MKTSKVTHCPVCGEQLSLFDRTHVREKHWEYFHEVRKWQRANILSSILFLSFLTLDFFNNVFYSNIFLRVLFPVRGLIVVSFFFFTLLKLRSVAKKYKVPWRKTQWLYGGMYGVSFPVTEAQKVVIRAVARATGRSEKEIEEKMKNVRVQWIKQREHKTRKA